MRKQAVKTVLQSVVLSKYTDSLPVMKARQRSAFPPNYIHSIDSSHMMLSALACAREGAQAQWDNPAALHAVHCTATAQTRTRSCCLNALEGVAEDIHITCCGHCRAGVCGRARLLLDTRG